MKSWMTSDGTRITRVISGRSNSFLLAREGGCIILVDTGPRSAWKSLDRRLGSLRVTKLDLLVLTHSHFDHAANARKLKDIYGARVVIHESEADCLRKGENIIPHGTNPVTAFLIRVFTGLFTVLARYEPCEPDIVFSDAFDLSGFGLNAKLMHAPGHTPGSSCLIAGDEIALVGDAMYGVFPWSVLPPFGNDMDSMIRSWGELLKTGCRLFLPSHGSGNMRKLAEKTYLRFSNRKR